MKQAKTNGKLRLPTSEKCGHRIQILDKSAAADSKSLWMMSLHVTAEPAA